jgi:rubrerythrin
MFENNNRKLLISILQMAYSGELAAGLAYRGHWHSVMDPKERQEIQKIENEEWRHRKLVGEMLADLQTKSIRYRSARRSSEVLSQCSAISVVGLRQCLVPEGWKARTYANTTLPLAMQGIAGAPI